MSDNYIYVLKNTKKLRDVNTGKIHEFITSTGKFDTNPKPLGLPRAEAIELCLRLGMDPDISVVRPEDNVPIVLHASARKLPYHTDEDTGPRGHRDGITLM